MQAITLRTTLLAMLCSLGCLVMVAKPVRAELQEGRDYVVLRPSRPVANRDQVEVVEYFSWGCAGCYQLYPHLTQWASNLSKDVALVKTPVSLGHEQWVPLAKGFHALQYSGDLKRLDGAVFKAIHDQRVNLFTEQKFADWAVKQGVDARKLPGLVKPDMSVEAKVKQADIDSRSIPISGTPSIIVDGKYLLQGSVPYDQWPAQIDQLIAKARADRQAATGKQKAAPANSKQKS